MKIGILILLLALVSCGKETVTTGTGQTIDGFTRGYQDQISRGGVAKLGETVTLFQEMQTIINNKCTYDYAYGERTIINTNPKLVKIYSKEVWNLAEGRVSECKTTRVDETVYLVPSVKLQELFIKGVTKKCDYLKGILDNRSAVTFCQQSYLGNTTFRSEVAGIFKTTLTLDLRGKSYNIIDDSTHLATTYLWMPYPVSQRTLVNGEEQKNHFTKTVIDYYTKEIDDRDYDHIFEIDYYDGWEL